MVAFVSDIDRPFKKMCEQQQQQQQQDQPKAICSLPLSPDLDCLTPEQKLQLDESRWKLHRCLSQSLQQEQSQQQCSNLLLQRIDAPLAAVWPLLRRFDMPQVYKRFVKACVMKGDGNVGSLRDITLVSGLPASCSQERLEILDDEHHILSFRVIGGEHRLRNYASITSLHEFQLPGATGSDSIPPQSQSHSLEEASASPPRVVTVVMESYVVDVPEGNTKEDTRLFTDTVVRCNLRSLARISQANFKQQQQLLRGLKLQQVDGLILMR